MKHKLIESPRVVSNHNLENIRTRPNLQPKELDENINSLFENKQIKTSIAVILVFKVRGTNNYVKNSKRHKLPFYR